MPEVVYAEVQRGGPCRAARGDRRARSDQLQRICAARGGGARHPGRPDDDSSGAMEQRPMRRRIPATEQDRLCRRREDGQRRDELPRR